MKKAGIPEHIAKKYFYTTGNWDEFSPCNCLNRSFFETENKSTVLPLPEIGSDLLLIQKKISREVNPYTENRKTGINSMLSHCSRTTVIPVTGLYLSDIHLLVQTSEIRNHYPLAYSVPDS